jgi:glycosyltransferase involved in cell wall biosynthesis
MAICRVYLCTYRRNDTLPRALESLRRQTLTDWVCELHNDAPDEPFPAAYVQNLGDPRITVVNHEKNLGPTRTFNLVYRSVPESFVSLLEDDNWWEDNFLEVMVAAMNTHPEVDVAWANMRIWRESPAGEWSDTGSRVWPEDTEGVPRLFVFPNKRQIIGALHSNGAMLVRTRRISEYQIPECTTFAAVEPVRERAFRFPIMLVPQALGNFSVTQGTAQSKNLGDWEHVQLLLAASYLRHVAVNRKELQKLWQEYRTGPVRETDVLLLAGLLFSGCRYVLRYARVRDILLLIASYLRHPRKAIRVVRQLRKQKDLWHFLDRCTRLRALEAGPAL